MAAIIKHNIRIINGLRFLQVPLDGHPPPELHVRQLLRGLLEFGETWQRLIEHQQQLAGQEIEEAHAPIRRYRGETSAVGRERQTRHIRFVFREFI